MITRELARALRDAGLRWHPAVGDRFQLDLPDEVELEVEADVFAATRVGRPYADVFDDVRVAYARHGFGDDAWTRHHQGGPTGYAGRDPKLAPGATGVVAEDQAFAWNPWVPGAKLEDTILIRADGVEVLTHDPDWPTTDVRGLARPLPLSRR